MPAPVNERLLTRVWLRSHEEDTPGHAVYRPATYNLPPARGRTGFEFRPGGVAVKRAPGPTDRASAVEGTWTCDAQGCITISIPGAPEEYLQVTSLDADRLVVAK